MKKILLLFTILFMSVITTACINNLAIQELNNKAADYMDKGDTETAICRLKSSLDLDNDIYQTHYNLAVAYNEIGKYNEAIEELNNVLRLKPDFYDAYYTLAIAKDAIAYQRIEIEPDEHGNIPELTLEEISEFNNKAADAVETYNTYLVKDIKAAETDQINNNMTEVNEKIKEYTQLYDSKSQEVNNAVSESIKQEEQ